jgi:hypothetical protein
MVTQDPFRSGGTLSSGEPASLPARISGLPDGRLKDGFSLATLHSEADTLDLLANRMMALPTPAPKECGVHLLTILLVRRCVTDFGGILQLGLPRFSTHSNTKVASARVRSERESSFACYSFTDRTRLSQVEPIPALRQYRSKAV